MKESLPIDAVLPELLERLRSGPAVVLEAPPGAGKTTRVPPALLELVQEEVVVLEPRRIAARAAARRVQAEGADAGFQIRFEKSGPRAPLKPPLFSTVIALGFPAAPLYVPAGARSSVS